MVPLLSGLRVIDLTTVIYGPLIGQILGDFGADIIKVEAPEGDIARETYPRSDAGDAAMYLNNNRNKRGIVLDLNTPGGVAVLRRLLTDADVFIHNMRVAAIDRLGFGFADVAAVQAAFFVPAGSSSSVINLGQGDFVVLNGVTSIAPIDIVLI